MTSAAADHPHPASGTAAAAAAAQAAAAGLCVNPVLPAQEVVAKERWDQLQALLLLLLLRYPPVVLLAFLLSAPVVQLGSLFLLAAGGLLQLCASALLCHPAELLCQRPH
jgi:hypothetical protein